MAGVEGLFSAKYGGRLPGLTKARGVECDSMNRHASGPAVKRCLLSWQGVSGHSEHSSNNVNAAHAHR